MAGPGRNARCPCGSGKKVKHCCGESKGPSEADLAWAFLAEQRRDALPSLRNHTDSEIDELWEKAIDLPEGERVVQLAPTIVTPEDEMLLDAMSTDDLDGFDVAFPRVLDRFDTPRVRARLTHAVIALRETGRITPELAAIAIFDLADRQSTDFVQSAIVHGYGVAAGALATPSGLKVSSP
jgi:hypothetical protein